MQGIRIGELLVAQGVLRSEQVDHLLSVQAKVGRPLGDLAERLYGVSPRTVERAWAAQYANFASVDPRTLVIDHHATRVICRRQAWQFHVVPFGRTQGELQILTAQQHLVRAVNFASATLRAPAFFVLCESAALREMLMEHYPVPQHLADFATSLN